MKNPVLTTLPAAKNRMKKNFFCTKIFGSARLKKRKKNEENFSLRKKETPSVKEEKYATVIGGRGGKHQQENRLFDFLLVEKGGMWEDVGVKARRNKMVTFFFVAEDFFFFIGQLMSGGFCSGRKCYLRRIYTAWCFISDTQPKLLSPTHLHSLILISDALTSSQVSYIRHAHIQPNALYPTHSAVLPP